MNPKDERREHYRHSRPLPTRWRDNDVYHHINNVIYYEFFDTVINGYLMEEGGLDFSAGEQVGYAVETHCTFLKPVRFLMLWMPVCASGNWAIPACATKLASSSAAMKSRRRSAISCMSSWIG